MTDPERISQRSAGLSAQLLQAGADEEPGAQGMQRTLAALGVSTAVVATTSTASAVAGSAKLSAAGGASAGTAVAGGALKAASTTLLVKWIGIGVVGGVGLAGVAAVATTPTPPEPQAPVIVAAARRAEAPQVAPVEPVRPSASVALPEPEAPAPPAAVAARGGVAEPAAEPPLEVGAPLAAEVSYVDRARALLRSGQTEQGLSLLQGYEQTFPEARLLPEVLFLRLETCDRLGRKGEAQAAAQRLLDGFPKSPHAARARKVLGESPHFK